MALIVHRVEVEAFAVHAAYPRSLVVVAQPAPFSRSKKLKTGMDGVTMSPKDKDLGLLHLPGIRRQFDALLVHDELLTVQHSYGFGDTRKACYLLNTSPAYTLTVLSCAPFFLRPLDGYRQKVPGSCVTCMVPLICDNNTLPLRLMHPYPGGVRECPHNEIHGGCMRGWARRLRRWAFVAASSRVPKTPRFPPRLSGWGV
eukprot:scaffold7462_cov430-Prasinococcus_capsulatus_cf.AAC.3